jgi:prevent-host-death family protein
MQTVNIHEAKTHLSRLIDGARQGEAFIIAKAGKPVVKVSAIAPENGRSPAGRLGFMKGMMQVPDDFDRMGGDGMAHLFTGTALDTAGNTAEKTG